MNYKIRLKSKSKQSCEMNIQSKITRYFKQMCRPGKSMTFDLFPITRQGVRV